jgi:integrase
MFMLQRAAVLPGEFALLHKLTKLFGRLFLNSAQLLQDWAVERKLFDRPRALSEADNLLSAYQQPRRATGNALHLRSRGAVFYHLQEVIVRRLKYTETNLAAGNPVLHGLRCELGRVLGYQSDEIGVCLPLCQRAPVNMRPPRNLLIRKPVFSHQHSRGLVLRKAKLWSNIEDDVVMLKERTDIGRELSDDEIHRLLTICKGSVSRGIYPAVLTSIHTGLRSQELRLLRLLASGGFDRGNYHRGQVQDGRRRRAPGLPEWTGSADLAELAIAILGCAAQPCGVPKRTIRAQRKEGIIWRPGRALRDVSRQAYPKLCEGMEDRQESGRRRMPLARSAHSCTSRLAAGGATDATLQALLGWMSPKMIEMYSHVRAEAKRKAVAVFDVKVPKSRSPQKPPQEDIDGNEKVM